MGIVTCDAYFEIKMLILFDSVCFILLSVFSSFVVEVHQSKRLVKLFKFVQ